MLKMQRNRLAWSLLTALTAAALVAPPAWAGPCDMTGHETTAVAHDHQHEAPIGATLTAYAGCADCGAMAGCCIAPTGALYVAAPEIPSTPEHGQDALIAREHRASSLRSPITPPPRA